MKCFSCETEINPRWKNAIESNVCPFCGEHIVDEKLKTLLSTLRETMDGMKEFQQELDDWMLSNHNYIKTNAENLHTFIPKEILKEAAKEDKEEFEKRKNKKFKTKVSTDLGEEEVVVEQIQSNEEANEFAKRAEATKFTEKTQSLKEKVKQIKSGGAAALTAMGGGVITADMVSNLDKADVSLYESQITGGADMEALTGGEPYEYGDPNDEIDDIGVDDDLPPSPFVNMPVKKAGRSQQQQADLDKLRALQANAGGARKRLLSGKGGFSRG